MDNIFGRRSFNLRTICNFDAYGKDIQTHLKNVYATLAMGMLAAAAGAYIFLFTQLLQAGFLTSIVSLGCVLGVYFIPHRRENVGKRMALFLGAAFLTGLSLGPLMAAVHEIDETIIPTAFLCSSVIFICFSLHALFTKQRSYLYLGGTLFSMLMVMMVVSLMNAFIFRSPLVYTLELYAGLAIFCVFILFDTQLMVEKRRHGDDDFIWHALDLFIDFIEVFRTLMVILSRRSESRRRRNSD